MSEPIVPEISVHLNNPGKCFTSGDTVSGKVVVESRKSFRVETMQATMRCREIINVRQYGGQYDDNYQHVKRDIILFPTTQQVMDSSTFVYTVADGMYEYPFEFTIPIYGSFPETMDADSSRIRWYIEGTATIDGALYPRNPMFKVIEVRPQSKLSYSNKMTTSTADISVQAFLPGYAAWAKSPSGMWKDLVPGNMHYRKNVDVHLSMDTSISGLRQHPHPIEVLPRISCDDEGLLTITEVSMILKRKVVISTEKVHHEVHNAYEIVSKKSLNWPFKTMAHELEQELNKQMIVGRHPSNLKTNLMSVTYKLVLVVKVASREKPTAIKKLRLSVPIYLNRFNPKDLEQ